MQPKQCSCVAAALPYLAGCPAQQHSRRTWELTQTVRRLRLASSAGMPTCGSVKGLEGKGVVRFKAAPGLRASRRGSCPAYAPQRSMAVAGSSPSAALCSHRKLLDRVAARFFYHKQLTVSTTRPSASCSRNLRVPSAADTEWCSTERPVRTPCTGESRPCSSAAGHHALQWIW